MKTSTQPPNGSFAVQPLTSRHRDRHTPPQPIHFVRSLWSLTPFMFGSVTERVSHGTDIPVVVVKHESGASEADVDATAESSHESASAG